MTKEERQRYYGTETFGHQKWTLKEIRFLEQQQDTLNIKEMARILHRTPKSVEHKKRRLKEVSE
jgi:hypothetical protein